MLDWAKITSDAEHALTLDGEQRAVFLSTLTNQEESRTIQDLIERSAVRTSFLATSAPDEVKTDDISSSTHVEIGASIGAWKIEASLGKGGMGEVYRATRADGLYEQTVALKVIQGMSQQRASQFEIERRRLALMDHAGIARIIDGGESHEGIPFMVMEYVDGEPLADYVAANSLTLSRKLALFLALCEAVQYAHAKLILHRDIKSDNVLVGFDENVKLIDFGIASGFSESSEDAGGLSIASAAPEQLLNVPVSIQTDVFALGVLLHELVTGLKPKRQQNGGMQAIEQAFQSPDLLAIVAKALAFDPQHRYRSTALLSEDISAYLQRRPVDARQGGWAYAAGKFIQRYPLANAFAFIAVTALVGGLTVSLNFAKQAELEAQRANKALVESEQSLKKARFFLDRADVFHATQSAYADMLQSMFGAEADVEKQTRILKDRWKQAHALRKDDPNNAAFLSYAIGRHFLFRNDYLTAIDILQPWVNEAYGSEILLGHARQLLAIAYFSVGRDKEALPILRQAEKWLGSSFDAGTPDHIAAATQIALLSRETEDILAAESLLLEGLQQDHTDPIKMYFWNQTSKLRQMRGDFDGAYQAVSEVVNIIDAKPLMEISGTDTGLLNLAHFELWHRNDFQKAEQLAKRVIATAKEKKGDSRELGLAYATLANISMLSSNPQKAKNEIEQAKPLIERFSGTESDAAYANKIVEQEILAALGDDAASQTITNIIDELIKKEASPSLLARASLSAVYISIYLEGAEAAKVMFAEKNFSDSTISESIELSFLYAQLSDTLGISVGN